MEPLAKFLNVKSKVAGLLTVLASVAVELAAIGAVLSQARSWCLNHTWSFANKETAQVTARLD